MRTPLLSFEGFEPGSAGELETHVDAILCGRRHPPGRHDNYGFEWLVRLWKAAGVEARELIAGSVGRALSSSDTRCRSESIRFFQRCEADDRGALHAALIYHPDLFEGVEDPIPGATGDLRGEALRAVAHEPSRARPVVETLRAEALSPGRAGPVLLGLLQIDLAWVREHAVTIVSRTQQSYVTLIVNYTLLGMDTVELEHARHRAP